MLVNSFAGMARSPAVGEFKLGALLWTQATSWEEMRRASERIDAAGYEHLWFYDHLHAINTRDPYLPIFEGWAVIAGLATITETARLGLLVGANTFRNPGVVAKTAITVDHMSGGRAMVGLGGAWNEHEHRSFGLEFGSSTGERLDWLDEAAGAIRRLLDGEVVTSDNGDHYSFDEARLEPAPLQRHLPIMIGGSGERKTLRTVARHADMWNVFGDAERLASKDAVLRRHCEEAGRDPRTIERTVSAKLVIRDSVEEAREVWAAQMVNNRCPEEDWDDPSELWLGPPEHIAEEIRSRRAVGFDTFIGMLAAPFDPETIDRLIGEVKPMVDSG
jgi:alkanesulfonate monooxygenase SsuD/methylene tetrahydromethanopterin reductase-like flavin-dependent oxidoreductase (luciferase family)